MLLLQNGALWHETSAHPIQSNISVFLNSKKLYLYVLHFGFLWLCCTFISYCSIYPSFVFYLPEDSHVVGWLKHYVCVCVCIYIYIYLYLFINCNWVVTWWQWYSTHLHPNNTHRTTQNKKYIEQYNNINYFQCTCVHFLVPLLCVLD